jgi:hypothetical protein
MAPKILLMIILLFLCSCGLKKDPTSCEPILITPVPAEAIKRGEEHIIKKVGEKYFEENYRFISEKSYGGMVSNCNLMYLYFFEYKVLSRLTGKEETVSFILSWPGQEKSFGAISLNRAGELVEPKISRKDAEQILKRKLDTEYKEYYDPHFSPDCGTESYWCWQFSPKKYLDCQEVAPAYQVDIVTGDVAKTVTGGICE